MNKVTLVGRLGQDPKRNESGKVLSFSIATNDGFGENKKTNWHNCKAFGKCADIIEQYVKKGDQLAVNGSVDVYKSADGKYFTSILVNDFTLLSSKSETEPASVAETNENDDVPF